MSLICPHASCDVLSRGSVSIEAVVCNCHGSVFDGITIDRSQVVDASPRTAA